MKPVPRALLERLQDLAPPGAEVVPLEWAYDGEDYHLTVFVEEEEDRRVRVGVHSAHERGFVGITR